MPANTYIGINGKARHIKNIYIGVNGKARKVKNGWIGVDGKARRFYMSEYYPSTHGYTLMYTMNSNSGYIISRASLNPIVMINTGLSGIGVNNAFCGSKKYFYTTSWCYDPETLAYVRSAPGGNLWGNGTEFGQCYTTGTTNLYFKVLNEDTYAYIYQKAGYQNFGNLWRTPRGSGSESVNATTYAYAVDDSDTAYVSVEINLNTNATVRTLEQYGFVASGGSISVTQWSSWGTTYMLTFTRYGCSVKNYSSLAQVSFLRTGSSSSIIFDGVKFFYGDCIKK